MHRRLPKANLMICKFYEKFLGKIIDTGKFKGIYSNVKTIFIKMG